MQKVSKFFSKRGWNVKDAPLKGLGMFVDAKFSSGGGNSSRGTHRHTNNEHEIFLVISGTAMMVVDGQEIKLGRGDGEVDFLVTGNEEHGMFSKSEDFQCAIILLKPER